MGLLLVSASSEDTIAAPGNRQPNDVIASVTEPNGDLLQASVRAT
jgi:hypothetical protein